MNEVDSSLETIDIKGILRAIPHRYPFLMVDRIISIKGDDFAIGIKNITANEPQFQGHFPDNPVFPACYCSKAWPRPPASSACRCLA